MWTESTRSSYYLIALLGAVLLPGTGGHTCAPAVLELELGCLILHLASAAVLQLCCSWIAWRLWLSAVDTCCDALVENK